MTVTELIELYKIGLVSEAEVRQIISDMGFVLLTDAEHKRRADAKAAVA
jgi:hypothetical protein